MNSIDAAHATVHDYPGGSESLGSRVGISPAVLRNKVNPNNDTHHLTFAEARRIATITGDYRMLNAWAHETGHLVIKAPADDASECDMSVLETVVDIGVANGYFMQCINAALADGKVEKHEIEIVRHAQRILQTAAAKASQRLEGMSE